MARPRSRFDSEKSLGDLEHDSDLSHSSEDDKDSVVFGISGPRNWGVQELSSPPWRLRTISALTRQPLQKGSGRLDDI